MVWGGEPEQFKKFLKQSCNIPAGPAVYRAEQQKTKVLQQEKER
jgi:hypothetical protein